MKKTKRRQPGEGSIHQRPNGTWCGQLDLGIGRDGERRRRTFYGKTADQVQRKMTMARQQLREHGDLATSDTPLGKWLDYWLTDIAARRLKPNTWRSYRTAVNHHIKPSIGNIRLGRLAPQHLRKMYDDLTTRTGKSGKTLSPTTAHNAHRILSAALKDAMLEGKVARNIAAEMPAPRRADSDRAALSADAAKAVLRAADGPLRGRWMLALLYGMRQGERLGLRWAHVDFERNLLDLSWSLARISWAHGCGQDKPEHTARSCPARRMPIPAGMRHVPLEANYALLTPKTRGSVRVVPMLPPIRAALTERLELVKAERPGYAHDHDLVWCHPTGAPIDPRDDWTDWRALLKAAGLPAVTLHEARNTAATLLLEGGIDAKVIGAILGHSSVVTTRGYQTVTSELSRRALEGLAVQLGLPAGEAGA